MVFFAPLLSLAFILAYSASMYLENVFLHGGPAPALPGILPVRALKESESAVDNGSMFSTTYLPIIAFSSVCVTSFCEAGAETSSCLDGSMSFAYNRRGQTLGSGTQCTLRMYVLAFYLKEIKVVTVPPLWKCQLSPRTRHCQVGWREL